MSKESFYDAAFEERLGHPVDAPERCPTCNSRGSGGPCLCPDRWHVAPVGPIESIECSISVRDPITDVAPVTRRHRLLAWEAVYGAPPSPSALRQHQAFFESGKKADIYYILVVRFAQVLADAEPRWVSVGERMATSEEQQRGVLVIGPLFDGPVIASTDSDGIWWHADCAKLVSGLVTHWMPLPAPPSGG